MNNDLMLLADFASALKMVAERYVAVRRGRETVWAPQEVEKSIAACRQLVSSAAVEDQTRGTAALVLVDLLLHASDDSGCYIEEAIAICRDYLSSRPPCGIDHVYALLGHAYMKRRVAPRSENIESAICSFMRSLDMCSRENDPYAWCVLCHSLGNAHFARGSDAHDTSDAIRYFEKALSAIREDDASGRWPIIQSDLGLAYLRRNQGGDIELAIERFIVALESFNPLTQARLWAHAHHRLGIAFGMRRAGSQSDNCDSAISHFESGLLVFDEERHPIESASTQLELARMLVRRAGAKESDDLERAITILDRVVSVCERSRRPSLHASAQFTRGRAYMLRKLGDRRANLQRAIECFQSAITLFSPTSGRTRRMRAHREILRAVRLLGDDIRPVEHEADGEGE